MGFQSIIMNRFTFFVDVFFQSIIFYTSYFLTLNPLQFLMAHSSNTFIETGS
jgi:hypothetical protein